MYLKKYLVPNFPALVATCPLGGSQPYYSLKMSSDAHLDCSLPTLDRESAVRRTRRIKNPTRMGSKKRVRLTAFRGSRRL